MKSKLDYVVEIDDGDGNREDKVFRFMRDALRCVTKYLRWGYTVKVYKIYDYRAPIPKRKLQRINL